MNIYELPTRPREPDPPATCPTCDQPMTYEGRWLRAGVDAGHSLWKCEKHGGVCSPDFPIFPEPDPRALTAARNIWDDLCGRRGVKHELHRLDPDMQEHIVQTHAWMIGQCLFDQSPSGGHWEARHRETGELLASGQDPVAVLNTARAQGYNPVIGWVDPPGTVRM